MSERIAALTAADALWESVARCAEACSWRAGKSLASAMREGRIAGWERVFAALDGGQIAGFCTLCAEDCRIRRTSAMCSSANPTAATGSASG